MGRADDCKSKGHIFRIPRREFCDRCGYRDPVLAVRSENSRGPTVWWTAEMDEFVLAFAWTGGGIKAIHAAADRLGVAPTTLGRRMDEILPFWYIRADVQSETPGG